MTRRAARVDANHREVIQALRAAGCIVADTSRLGSGFPDAIATRRPDGSSRVVMLEIKDGAKPPSARKLTEAEAEFARVWGDHCVTVTSAEEALRALGVGVA